MGSIEKAGAGQAGSGSELKDSSMNTIKAIVSN